MFHVKQKKITNCNIKTCPQVMDKIKRRATRNICSSAFAAFFGHTPMSQWMNIYEN